jgi:quercetin dioxygenase-like cupin family protein
MNTHLPKTIENHLGERLTFKEIVSEPDGDKVIIEAVCKPGAGPVMHVHFQQDEEIKLVKGKLAYQLLGKEPVFVKEGESVLFKRGEAHKFWNAGDTDMQMEGWVKPANSIVFFLSALYDAQNKSGKHEPEPFDGAYLTMRYKSEYDLPELPSFVKNIIIPVTYFIGKLTGKYEKFKNAPEPLK